MPRPSIDEMRKKRDELEEEERQAISDRAARELAEAITQWYDPSLGVCPFCIDDDGHQEGCPHPVLLAYWRTFPLFERLPWVQNILNLEKEIHWRRKTNETD